MLVFTACSANPEELAARYKLELQYADYALKFAEQNMTKEAFESCNRTAVLRSECFTGIAMNEIGKRNKVEKSWCDEIIPDKRMDMTKKAFEIAYPEQDANLKKEISEKLRPSKNRIQTLQKIRQECMINSR